MSLNSSSKSISSEEANLESDQHHSSLFQDIENQQTIHLINVKTKTCKKSKIGDILLPDLFKIAGDEYIILIQKATPETIIKIRKAYNLHPVIDYECNSLSYIKDHMIRFDNYLFITLADIPQSGTLRDPSPLKIIFTQNLMFILINEKLHCIEEIFAKSMNFNIFNETSPVPTETEDVLKKSADALFSYKKRFTIKLDLVQFYELTKLEEVLYKILHVMFIRIVELVAEIDQEVTICNNFARELDTDERIDFVMRVQVAKKTLILARSFVDSKAKLLPDIIKTQALTRPFNQYLYCMALNMEKLTEKIDSSCLLLKNSETVNEAIVEGQRSEITSQATKLIKLFSSITTLFLPLYMVGGYFGMNMYIPFVSTDYNTLTPFIFISSLSIGYLAIAVLVFKYKGWI